MDELTSRVHRANVISSEIIALGVKKITFQVLENFTFSAGQYIWLELPRLLVADPRGDRRAYSVCVAPNNNNTISIIARVGESGFTQTLFSLSNGAEVKIHGPFGSSFVIENKKRKNLIMIAGGIGVAPFASIAESLSTNKGDFEISLLYFNHNEAVTPFLREFEKFRKANKNFTFVPRYDHFKWEDVEKYVLDTNNSLEYWISGTQGFVDSVSKILKDGGVSMVDMVFENFYPTSSNTLNFDKVQQSLKDNNILTQAIQNSTNHTVITDINGIVLFANHASQKITGYSNSEMLGNTPRLWGGMMSPDFYKKLWESKISGRSYDGEIINRRKNGELYYALAHISAIINDKNEIIGYIGTETDITNIKKHQEEVERMNEIMVGRELKMIELKKEIINLKSNQIKT